jgi:hypothetical protein
MSNGITERARKMLVRTAREAARAEKPTPNKFLSDIAADVEVGIGVNIPSWLAMKAIEAAFAKADHKS